MDKYDLLKLNHQLCFPLYAASKEIIRRYRPYLEPLGLTYTQYIAMMVLWERGEVSVKSLGERLYLDSGTLTPMLKMLESKGFVQRKRSKEDERVLLVSLTERGAALREEALKVPQQLEKRLPLSDREGAVLYQLLYKILDAPQKE